MFYTCSFNGRINSQIEFAVYFNSKKLMSTEFPKILWCIHTERNRQQEQMGHLVRQVRGPVPVTLRVNKPLFTIHYSKPPVRVTFIG